MNSLIVYMVKASVYLAGFYLVYRLFLSRDTLYGRNRTFILLSVIFALILPLITIKTNKPLNLPIFGKVLSDIFIIGDGNNGSLADADASTLAGYRWISRIYYTGITLFGLKLLIDLIDLFFIITRNEKRGSHVIRFRGISTSGFSAFGHVFINSRLSPDEAYEIIRHEQNHLNHHHSVDIVFIEAVKVLQWFNPFIHLFSRSLREVHEFQADEECLSKGTTVKNYQKLLLNQVFKSKVFTVTNSFSNPSLIKSRMIMMTKQRSKSLANLKLLIILPVIVLLLLSFSTCTEQTTDKERSVVAYMESPPPPPPPPVKDSKSAIVEETPSNNLSAEPFVVVEEMPMFPGGEMDLLKFIADNTKYPESAKIRGIQGKVIIRFAVNEKGYVTRESVLKGVDPDLDAEALRVVKTLPQFEPGRQGGKPVSVWYMVPINFTLK